MTSREKEKLGNILRYVGDNISCAFGAKTGLHAMADRLWRTLMADSTKASDQVAIAAFLRDTMEGKPKESIEISKGNDITPEMLAAKRLELEQAMLPSPPSRVSHADTTQAGDQGQQVGEGKA